MTQKQEDMGASPDGDRAVVNGAASVSALRASIPSAVEGAARAIAASKRGMEPSSSAVDRVWQSYVGQAEAAIAAANPGIELELATLKLTARWLAEVSCGCEEVTCADPEGENCWCFERLVGMYRTAQAIEARRAETEGLFASMKARWP